MSPQRKKGSRGSGFSKYASVELEIEKGPGEGQIFDLDEGETSIGRADDCDIRIDCGSASRHHATVRRKGESIVIADEKSHNGTFINEKEIRRPTKIYAGDRIQIGDSVLCLIVDGSKEREDDDDLDDEDSSDGLKTSFKAIVFFLTIVIFTSVFVFVIPQFRNFSSPRSSGTEESSFGGVQPAAQTSPVISTAPALPAAAASAVQISAQPVSAGAQPLLPAGIQKVPLNNASSVPAPASSPERSSSGESASASSSHSGSYRSASGGSSSGSRRGESAAASGGREREIDSRREEEAERSKSSDGTRSRDEKRVRSLYIAGKVGEALDLAENVGTSRLASQLRRFSKAESEAKAALASRKGTEAIQKYADADAIDQEIIGDMDYETESVPGKRVRTALSSLYQKAGEAYAAKGDKEHASDFLQRSLDYNKNNARSRKLLNSLGVQETDDDEGGREDGDEDDTEGDDEEL